MEKKTSLAGKAHLSPLGGVLPIKNEKCFQLLLLLRGVTQGEATKLTSPASEIFFVPCMIEPYTKIYFCRLQVRLGQIMTLGLLQLG